MLLIDIKKNCLKEKPLSVVYAQGSALYTACDALGAWCCCIKSTT